MNLNQVTVPVSDVQRSITFYRKLGLKLIVRALPHYARFECPDGDSTFSVHQETLISTAHGCWIYFEVQDLDEYADRLLRQGIGFEELPNDKPWLWREARLKDPDGHLLILYFAGSNRKCPPWRIHEE